MYCKPLPVGGSTGKTFGTFLILGVSKALEIALLAQEINIYITISIYILQIDLGYALQITPD